VDLTLLFFIILGVIAIIGAVGTIASQNPVTSAMSLVLHFFMLAGIYLTLQAQFIAVLQILVYAGAIMVLVIFVIMLLNLGKEHQLKEESNIRKYAGVAFGAVLAAQVALLLVLSTNTFEGLKSKAAEISTVEALGKVLFNDFLFQFEAITLLLLIAVMGALILARRRRSHESYSNNY
jgi:NADH-quinone oxidoreductase subunit J